MGTEAHSPSVLKRAAVLAAVTAIVARAAVALVALAAPACSLLIDFDAYRDSGAASADGGGADGEADAEEDASCDGSDRTTDPNNCGACSHVCVEGAGSCVDGRCPITPVYDVDGGTVQTLVTPSRQDAGGFLYFTTDEPFVGRRALTASGAIELDTTSGESARAVALNAGGTLGVTALDNKTIATFQTKNFTTQPPLPISTDHVNLGPLWLSGTEVFWGDSEGAWWSATTRDASPGGGPDASAGVPVAFAELNGTVLWVTGGGAVFSVDANAPGRVTRLISGGTETFACLGVSKTYLYLCERTPIGGGLVVYAVANLSVPLRTIALVDPQAVATDGELVYVVDFRSKAPSDSRLVRAKADGTQTTVLADGFRSSRGLAVDEQWVYFGDGPRIVRTSK